MAFSYYISLKLGGRSLPLPPWTIRNKTFPSYPNLVLVRTQFVDSKYGIFVELGLKLESVQTSVFADWGLETQTIILTENVQSWFFLKGFGWVRCLVLVDKPLFEWVRSSIVFAFDPTLILIYQCDPFRPLWCNLRIDFSYGIENFFKPSNPNLVN